MTYDTVVASMFEYLPRLKPIYAAEFDYMNGEMPGPSLAFGGLLIPALKTALAAHNLGGILPICAFLEEASEAARHDARLASLIQTEVGAWLGWVEDEELLTPWLGVETKRICGYVPGLATQRLEQEEQASKESFSRRILRFLRR